MMDKIKNFLKIPIVKHVLIGIGAFVGLIVIISFVLRFYTRHGDSITLPDFIGKTLEQVENMDESSPFTFIVVDSVYMQNKPKGSIFSQDPPVGSTVKSGRKIYVTTVAYGVPNVVMPNLTDLSLRQASMMLENLGLVVGNVVYQPSKYHNAVFEQLYQGRPIKAGTELKQGSKITLVVGKDSSVEEDSE